MGRIASIRLKRRSEGGSIRPGKFPRRKIAFLAVAVLLAAMLLACGVASPVGLPSAGPAAVTPPSSTSPTQAPLPATTAMPTQIPTATTTATPVPPTLTPTPALLAACQGAPASLSPDGQWVLCDLKDADGKSIAFVAGGNGRHWDVNYPKLAGPVPVYGDSHVLVWTPDDRYVYVAVVDKFDPSGGRAFYSASDIWRMDLSSGAVRDLIYYGEMKYESWFYDLSVSPDAQRLAYINQLYSPLALDILTLPADTKTEIKLDDNPWNAPDSFTAGELFWTPDGKSLVYKWVTRHSDNTCAYEYSILIMDLQNQSIQTIIPETHVPFCNGVPTEYHVVQVGDQQVTLVVKGVQWVYDLAAKTLIQTGTLTPTP